MKLFEVLKSAFEPFIDGEKPPLHVGEVWNLWFYLAGVEQTLRNDQVAFNIVEDPELKEILRDVIENVHFPMVKELNEFLRTTGSPLPDNTPEKPLGGDFVHIPEGAKLNDNEIANALAFSLLTGINLASQCMTTSIRADVAAMFAKFFMMKVTVSLQLKQLMAKRGWIKYPPQYKA